MILFFDMTEQVPSEEVINENVGEGLENVDSFNKSAIEGQKDGREKGPQGRYVKLDIRLGSGAYKDVWRAYDTNEGREVAWNEVKLKRIPPSERKRIKMEVKLLKDIEHKNVIKYYNSWVDRDREQIIFITEIMSHGSLKDYLKKNSIIRWNAVKRWCKQILKGLEFLHEKQIIHRDIKADNIFVNGATGDVRIGDLGLSTRISEERALQNGLISNENQIITTSTMTCLGTPEFMAPELYDSYYDEKVDIYAFGMTVLEMTTGLMPYHECTATVQIYKKVSSGILPPELSILAKLNNRCQDLVVSCLQNRNVRPSAKVLLTHEFFNKNDLEDFQEVGRVQPNSNNEEVYNESRLTESHSDIDHNDECDCIKCQNSRVKGVDNKIVAENHVIIRNDSSIATMKSSSQIASEILMEHNKTIEVINNNSHVLTESLLINETNNNNNNEINNSSHHASVSTNITNSDAADDDGIHLIQKEKLEIVLCSNYDEIGQNILMTQSRSSEQQDNKRISSSATRLRSRIIQLSLSPSKSLNQECSDSEFNESKASLLLLSGDDFDSTKQNTCQSISIPHFELSDDSTADVIVTDVISVPTVENENIYWNNQKIRIRLCVFAEKDINKGVDIQFDFDLIEDSIADIASEMSECEDLTVVDIERDCIIDAISPIIESAKKHFLYQSSLDVCISNRSDNNVYPNVTVAELAIQDIISSTEYASKSYFSVLKLKNIGTATDSNWNNSIITPTHESIDIKTIVVNDNEIHSQSEQFRSSSNEYIHKIDINNSVEDALALIDPIFHSILPTMHVWETDLDDEFNCEYQDLLCKYKEAVLKIEKDTSQKLNNLQLQKEKLDDLYKKEYEKLTIRKDDLDKQLESMMEKFKERMSIFDEKKIELEMKLSVNHLLEWNSVQIDDSTLNDNSSELSLSRSQHIERDRDTDEFNNNNDNNNNNNNSDCNIDGSYLMYNPYNLSEQIGSPPPVLVANATTYENI